MERARMGSLRKDVFVVLLASTSNRILVHPVWQKGCRFLPITYGYATTMRRAQGATLDLVGLCFDRKRPDPGYGYVGASRAKARVDVYLVGRVRRSDWRPVGGDAGGEDQVHPGPESESDSECPSSDEMWSGFGSEDGFAEGLESSRSLSEDNSASEPHESDFWGWSADETEQAHSYQGGFGEGHASSPSPWHPSMADDDVLPEADVEVQVQRQNVAGGLFEEK